MQNFITVAQSLLEEMAYFGLCPPKIGFFRGVGGSPNFFLLSLESYYFCELGAHAKFQIPTTLPYWVLTTAARVEKRKIPKIVAYGCFDTVCTAPLGLRLCQQPRAAHALRSTNKNMLSTCVEHSYSEVNRY